MVFFLRDVNFIVTLAEQTPGSNPLFLSRIRRSLSLSLFLPHSYPPASTHAPISRSESIDTIPSNFSRRLGRGQVIRAAAHTHTHTHSTLKLIIMYPLLVGRRGSGKGERGAPQRGTAAVIGPLRYSSLPDKVTVI